MSSIRSLSIFCLLLLASCATIDERRVTQVDSGKTVAIMLGENVAVELPSNRSTGYTWVVDHKPASLEQLGTPSYVGPTDVAPGADGREIFMFRAVAPGRDKLELAYRRPWEKDVAPARIFSAVMDVR